MKTPGLSEASQLSLESSGAELIAYIDGASRGNPGPASYGVVIQDLQGNTLQELSQFLGEATNNFAEYSALVAALEYAASRQCRKLKIFCDSELVARQMQGRYRVQSAGLKPLFERARRLASRIAQFSIQNIAREQNREADRIANQALDEASRNHRKANPVVTVSSAASPSTQLFTAVAEAGKLRPLAPLPELEEGTEYEVRATRLTSRPPLGRREQ
jgi:ribonuclease HI